jgi:hypothetical protein
LRVIIDKFKLSAHAWFLFAKFCAIYLLEHSLLLWVKTLLKDFHFKGILARKAKSDINIILKQRVTSLTRDLKVKLGYIEKKLKTPNILFVEFGILFYKKIILKSSPVLISFKIK